MLTHFRPLTAWLTALVVLTTLTTGITPSFAAQTPASKHVVVTHKPKPPIVIRGPKHPIVTHGPKHHYKPTHHVSTGQQANPAFLAQEFHLDNQVQLLESDLNALEVPWGHTEDSLQTLHVQISSLKLWSSLMQDYSQALQRSNALFVRVMTTGNHLVHAKTTKQLKLYSAQLQSEFRARAALIKTVGGYQAQISHLHLASIKTSKSTKR